MSSILEELKKLQNEWLILEKQLETELNNPDIDRPIGHLRIVSQGKTCKYYHWFNEHQNPGYSKQGRYIRKNEMHLIRTLAQQDYDRALHRKVHHQLKTLNRFLDNIDLDVLKSSYSSLHPFRQQLIVPYVLPDNLYAEQWQNERYICNNTYAFTEAEIFTLRGERVRSKSEKMLADYFYEMKIPYRYEFPLFLGTSVNPVYPDFILLNVKTRQEILWEHLGMMDDSEYAAAAVKKLNFYCKNGYIMGKNLITTMETRANPLNTTMIERLCEEFLL